MVHGVPLHHDRPHLEHVPITEQAVRARQFAERAFRLAHVGQKVSLDDNLRVGGHVRIDGLAWHEIDGMPSASRAAQLNQPAPSPRWRHRAEESRGDECEQQAEHDESDDEQDHEDRFSLEHGG